MTGMEVNRTALQADLDAFHISEEFGFLLKEPLADLPEYYRVWMDLANNINHLTETCQLRDLVHKMPVLSPSHLNSHREFRLAHLALGFITMGYVWQEGQRAPAGTLPRALAIPYWLVSCRLGLPPILTYADSVLANWKLRNPAGEMEIENMDLIFSFPGGESCRGFFLVSLLVEKAASLGLKGSLEVMHAMDMCDLVGIRKGLHKVALSLKKMKDTFQLMHQHVDPATFHGTLRIFLSGWRDNPMLPGGLLYEGVSQEPMLLSGGSAAQSSAIQCFDALLCIQHDDDTGAFLTRMRDYMPPAHRQLIETLSSCVSLREFVASCSSPALCHAYNSCVLAMKDLRSYHLCVVAKYVVVAGSRARAVGCPCRGAGAALDATGTGGSSPMVFLKSVRDATHRALIQQSRSESLDLEM